LYGAFVGIVGIVGAALYDTKLNFVFIKLRAMVRTYNRCIPAFIKLVEGAERQSAPSTDKPQKPSILSEDCFLKYVIF
jgi:hypothetical protein